MKKAIMIFCTGMLLLATSCENWLDVKPKAEIKWDVMFETEQGFKDAVIGCYYSLAEPNTFTRVRPSHRIPMPFGRNCTRCLPTSTH